MDMPSFMSHCLENTWYLHACKIDQSQHFGLLRV